MKQLCWLAVVGSLIAQPAQAYTCAHVSKGVELAGTTDLVGLEKAARDYGIKLTPALRRLVKNCLKQQTKWPRRHSFSFMPRH